MEFLIFARIRQNTQTAVHFKIRWYSWKICRIFSKYRQFS